MSADIKQEHVAHVANPGIAVVAEGTGKTAHNAGAKEKEVYNVCRLRAGMRSTREQGQGS
jgi:hypothetical protein